MIPAHRSLLALVALAAACSAPGRESFGVLRPGRFVEAKGNFVGGTAQVREIDEAPREPDDRGDKAEVTAPVERAESGGLVVLGNVFALADDTQFEDADKQPVARRTPEVGEWLRLKLRDKGDAGLRLRTVRAMAPRDQFKVTGEVRAVDLENGRLDVGGVKLAMVQDPDVDLPGRRDVNDPLSMFLADDQKAVPFTIRLGESLRLGGQGAGEVEWNDEFDLDAARDRDRTKPALRGKLDLLWLLDDAGSYALGEVAFGRDDTLRQGGEDTYDETLEVTRAFASVRLHERLQLLVGRQDFDGEREWLYDEVLDGARAVLSFGDVEVEIGTAHGRRALAEANANDDSGMLFGNARWRVAPDWQLAAYALQRTDRTVAGFEPLLLGVRSLAEPRYGFGHWCELGIARGDVGNRPVRGHAFDVGILHTFDASWRPALGVGIAHGSGTRDGADTVGYRQSGFQDNNGKLGGVTSVRYYGELLDPELANLTVLTACAAVRPIPGGSVSLLLHGYRQDVASALAPATELRTSPTGLSRDLGFEVDVVLGYRLARSLTVEVVFAHFEPGDAFATDDAATLLAFTTRHSF